MSLSTILFLIIIASTSASALGVVISRGIIRAAEFLLFSLVGVALAFFLLGAEFLGATQLMIYVGGTLVLVVFGGMLTAGGPYASFPVLGKEWFFGGLVSVGLFGLLVSTSLELGRNMTSTPNHVSGIGEMGLSFLGIAEKSGKPSFLLPFEIISVHLLVVLIGAAYLARSKKKPGSTGELKTSSSRISEEYEQATAEVTS